MSTKTQISSLCKLYSVYEEIPEEFLDETDSYFYHNILDISESHHRIVWVSRGSNKESSAFKMFHFCDSELQQPLILKEEVSVFFKKIRFLLDSLKDFLKAFDQANKVSQIPLHKRKFEIGFTNEKDELFSQCYKDIADHLNRQFRLSFRFEKNKTWVFSVKKLEHYLINSFLQKMSTWVSAKSNISTRIDFLLLTSVTFLRANTMCSAFTPDCRHDNSTIILNGDVYCPNTKCLGKHCLHKKTFHSLGRSEYQCPQCGSVCQVRNIPFEDQTNSSFLSPGQGVYILEESPKTVQDVVGDVCCPGKYCCNKEKCELLGWLCNNSEIHLCFWKLWSLVVCSQSAFCVTRARKDDKNRQNTFLICQKKMKLVHNKKLLLNVPFQSTKYRKKDLCVDNKVRETIGDVYCPTCRNEKCVYISTKNTSSVDDCKKCTACCNVLNILFKDKKPTNMLFGGYGTHCFAKKTSRDCGKKTISIFEVMSPPITTKHIQTWNKKG